MASLVFAAPILPGQLAAWQQFTRDLTSARPDEYRASRQQAGITVEQSWHQATPQGDLCLISLEADDLGRAFGHLATSPAPFDVWFRECVQTHHGIDLSQPMPGPIAVLMVDSVVAAGVQSAAAQYEEYIDVVWHQRDLDAMERYFVEDFVDHSAPPNQGPGRDGLKVIFAHFLEAFPDARVAIEEQIEVGDTLVSRIRFTGTQRATFFGIPPTNRPVTVSQIHIMKRRDGKFSEHWSNSDDLGMMVQLGIVPAAG